MPWRDSFPTRLALTTGALLALVMLITSLGTYAAMAFLMQRTIDAGLQSALPSAHDLDELLREPEEHGAALAGSRYLQVLDATGNPVLRINGTEPVAVAPDVIRTAVDRGTAFATYVEEHGVLSPRSGPAWWPALNPDDDDVRVILLRHAAPRSRRTYLVLLGVASGHVAGFLHPLLRWSLALTGLAALIAGLITWRMALAAFRPLQAITAVAGAISRETLSRRLPDRWSDRTLRRLVQVLNEMFARLEAAFAAQGRFVAAAAHELRSPIAALRAELEVTLRRDRSPQEYQEAVTRAAGDAARLGQLAEQLLLLARYERGARLAMVTDLAVAGLLTRSAAEVRHRAEVADVSLAVAAPADLLADGDAIALERLLANLLLNAVQASPPGATVTVAAASESRRDHPGVRITVSDQGHGIPAAALPHIFEPFYRVDAARSDGSGAGLGLSIVQTVVTAHRGLIDVQSTSGGTTFTVWLPRHQGPTADPT